MRSLFGAVFGSSLLIVGCASSPESESTPSGPVEQVAAEVADPYVVPFVSSKEQEGAVPAPRLCERVPEWTDARHVRAIEACLSMAQPEAEPGSSVFVGYDWSKQVSDLLRFESNGIAVRGTREQTAVVARFLRDRRRFERGQIFLESRVIELDARTAPELRPVPGGASGVLAALLTDIDALEGYGTTVQQPSLFVLDAQEAVIFVGDTIPIGAHVTHALSGVQIELTAALIEEDQFVVRVNGFVRSVVEDTDGRPQLLTTGSAASPASLPVIQDCRLAGRRVLREGEVFCLVTADPRREHGLLALLVQPHYVPPRETR